MRFKNLHVEGRVELSKWGAEEFLVLEPIDISWMEGNRWVSLRVPAGWKTDLSSIPKWALSLVGKIGNQDRASVVHDWLYLSQDKRGREFADDLFLAIMEYDGVGWFKRKIFYKAVKNFGQEAWDD